MRRHTHVIPIQNYHRFFRILYIIRNDGYFKLFLFVKVNKQMISLTFDIKVQIGLNWAIKLKFCGWLNLLGAIKYSESETSL